MGSRSFTRGLTARARKNFTGIQTAGFLTIRALSPHPPRVGLQSRVHTFTIFKSDYLAEPMNVYPLRKVMTPNLNV